MWNAVKISLISSGEKAGHLKTSINNTWLKKIWQEAKALKGKKKNGSPDWDTVSKKYRDFTKVDTYHRVQMLVESRLDAKRDGSASQ